MSIDIDNPLVVFKSDGRMYIMNTPKAMTFEEWMKENNYSLSGIDEQEAEFLIREAWKEAYRQGYKDGQATVKQLDDSEEVIDKMRHKNPRYKRWLALNYESE